MSFVGIILTAICVTIVYTGWMMIGNGFLFTIFGILLMIVGCGGYLAFFRKNFIVAILVAIVAIASLKTSFVKFRQLENVRQQYRAF